MKPLAWLSDEKVMDDGVAGNRLRNVTEPPPATERVAVSGFEYSMPRRPTSCTEPLSSKAEKDNFVPQNGGELLGLPSILFEQKHFMIVSQELFGKVNADVAASNQNDVH